jgi:hypothetical protein
MIKSLITKVENEPTQYLTPLVRDGGISQIRIV